MVFKELIICAIVQVFRGLIKKRHMAFLFSLSGQMSNKK